MTSPLDDLKERLEVLSDIERSLVVGIIAKDAISLAEAYREIAVHKCFLGVAQPIGDELIKKCRPLFYSQVDTTVHQILKTSREG